ncbi:hypothetical protein LTS18_005611 [Coniosporium uncinatum]|uniref:Uncharacterized protein n=1 Tax=Coniosporium uncinatum TaxID=93489 RepID=A0ACC3D4E8_9PEZI|nr:hypothetical protein LTS18_005611 [Coniosporium uncinatum]
MLKCARETETSAQFCFSIDGLDEHDDDIRIIDLIKKLNEPTNIKLCVSSWSRTAFDTTFGNTGYVLRMQEANEPDMLNYALSELARTDSSNVDCEPVYQQLAGDIAKHSNGVWLWT